MPYEVYGLFGESSGSRALPSVGFTALLLTATRLSAKPRLLLSPVLTHIVRRDVKPSKVPDGTVSNALLSRYLLGVRHHEADGRSATETTVMNTANAGVGAR